MPESNDYSRIEEILKQALTPLSQKLDYLEAGMKDMKEELKSRYTRDILDAKFEAQLKLITDLADDLTEMKNDALSKAENTYIRVGVVISVAWTIFQFLTKTGLIK